MIRRKKVWIIIIKGVGYVGKSMGYVGNMKKFIYVRECMGDNKYSFCILLYKITTFQQQICQKNL